MPPKIPNQPIAALAPPDTIPAAKRHAGSAEALARNSEAVTRGDLDGILNSAYERCSSDNKKTVQTILHNYDENIQQRFRQLEGSQEHSNII